MTDPSVLAEAIRQIAAGLPGVKDSHLGPLSVLQATPAAEVLVGAGRLSQLPAGGAGEPEEEHDLTVVFLIAMEPNTSTAVETQLGQLTKGLIDTINTAGFDDTLGGLAERTRATAYNFGATTRNRRAYRTAAVRIETGEL